METKVFVYGTLMSGEGNHAYLDRVARFEGQARTTRNYTLYDLGLSPCMCPDGHDVVHGEVYTVGSNLLAWLDRLEARYYRTQIELESGEPVQVYMLQPYGRLLRRAVRIESGDWRKPNKPAGLNRSSGSGGWR